MEPVEELKSWIREFVKCQGRKPQQEDFPEEMGRLFRVWSKQRAGSRAANATKSKSVKGGQPGTSEKNPFARQPAKQRARQQLTQPVQDVGTTLPKPQREQTQQILCSPAVPDLPQVVKAQQPTPGKACQKLAFFSPTQLLRPRHSQSKVASVFMQPAALGYQFDAEPPVCVRNAVASTAVPAAQASATEQTEHQYRRAPSKSMNPRPVRGESNGTSRPETAITREISVPEMPSSTMATSAAANSSLPPGLQPAAPVKRLPLLPVASGQNLAGETGAGRYGQARHVKGDEAQPLAGGLQTKELFLEEEVEAELPVAQPVRHCRAQKRGSSEHTAARLAKKGRKQVASCFNSDEDGTSSGVSFSLCGADPDEVGSTDSDAAENACPEPSGRRRPAAAARQPVNRRVPPKLKSAGAGVQKGRQNFVRMDKKGGSGRFGFKSKAGMKRKPVGKGRFGHRYAPKPLAQAGEGADFVDGWEPRSSWKCFRCGKLGHFANACPGLAGRDAQAGFGEGCGKGPARNTPGSVQQAAPAEPMLAAATTNSSGPATGLSEAVAALVRDSHNPDCPDTALVELLRSVFKHKDFRGPQLGVIRRVLRGESTLAILPTGAGKSLCYQLPALVQGGTALVVSPLIALMRDQLGHLPPELPGGMLWRGQAKADAMQTLRDLREGRLRVLFVAPERLHNAPLLQALQPLLPLKLVVVDEAHCVAEWGHNFRSAYFRLGHLLREKVPCRAVLALTATATRATQRSIQEVLHIPEANVVRDSVLPHNLRLRVQLLPPGLQGSLKPALLKVVTEGGEGMSTIVYTTFQFQADEVANYLYTHGLSAASYHAGKFDKERERIQKEFCERKIQVVVATLAFGMGLDVTHVRSVVHLNLPRSLEEYVQQVGRGGRSGQEGSCHMFLSASDFLRLRSLGHADSVDSCQVRDLLKEVFETDHCTASKRGAEKLGAEPAGRFAALGVAQLSQQLDMKEEVMETLLSYLEATGDIQLLQVLPPTSMSVTVAFYGDAPLQLAERHPVVQALLQVSKPRQGKYTAPMAALCNHLLLQPHQVLGALKELAVRDQLSFEMSKLQALAIEILERPHELPGLAEQLTQRHDSACRQQVARLDTAFRTFAAAAALADPGQQEALLRGRVAAYFEQATAVADRELDLTDLPLQSASPMLGVDCRALFKELQRNPGAKDAQRSARVMSRILHGLNSPAFPAKEWRKCGFWERYTEVDFATVLRVAKRQCSTTFATRVASEQHQTKHSFGTGE